MSIRLILRTDKGDYGITLWREPKAEPQPDREAGVTHVPSSNEGRAPQQRRQPAGFRPSRVKVEREP